MDKPCFALQGVTPSTDMFEIDDGFVILMDMPGVNQESLTIDVVESDLKVRGVNAYTRSCGSLKLMHSEFGTQEYTRSFTLSDLVDRENIQATLKDGVLELFLPRSQTMQPRRIKVTGS